MRVDSPKGTSVLLLIWDGLAGHFWPVHSFPKVQTPHLWASAHTCKQKTVSELKCMPILSYKWKKKKKKESSWIKSLFLLLDFSIYFGSTNVSEKVTFFCFKSVIWKHEIHLLHQSPKYSIIECIWWEEGWKYSTSLTSNIELDLRLNLDLFQKRCKVTGNIGFGRTAGKSMKRVKNQSLRNHMLSSTPNLYITLGEPGGLSEERLLKEWCVLKWDNKYESAWGARFILLESE